MGFDLYGLQPATEKGIYFRSANRQWFPLVNYLETVVSSSIMSCCPDWRRNSGNVVANAEARAIADILEPELYGGRTGDHERAFKARHASGTTVCEACGNGSRGLGDSEHSFWVGGKKVSPQELEGVTGADSEPHTGCIFCLEQKLYGSCPEFEVAHVARFCIFLFRSGGFRIC